MGEVLRGSKVMPELVHVIYDADVRGPDAEKFIDQMSPAFHMVAGYGGADLAHAHTLASVAGLFTQTEGDEEYEFTGEFGPGCHRKWIATLDHRQWVLFADAYLIEMDEDGAPAHFSETLGAITEYGHIPAVAVENSEGWETPALDASVICSQFYVSMGGGDSDLCT